MKQLAVVNREKILLDARRGARNQLKKLRKLEKETGSEVFINQANSVRKRISIYSQELNDIKNKKIV